VEVQAETNPRKIFYIFVSHEKKLKNFSFVLYSSNPEINDNLSSGSKYFAVHAYGGTNKTILI
jgi:hypothetical protein